MRYRVQESMFRNRSAHDPSNPPNPNSSSRRTFRPAAHFFAALLSILDPSTSLLRLLLRFILVIVRVRMPGILAAASLQEQPRSLGLGVTSSTSRKPLPDLADRPRNIPNGRKASRSRDRISEIPTAVPWSGVQVEELNLLLPL
jgi:hypothetical protein